MLSKIFRLIRLLVAINITRTLYINFKMLPFRVAAKFPIYVYGRAKFRELNGRISINAPIKRGMIKIGKNDYYVRTSVPLTYWVINGSVVFNGSTRFMNGGYMCVATNGILTIGDNTLIGSDYKIMCFESIKIGDNTECTYNCQMYDTSYHYMEQKNGTIVKLTKPIVIGDYVWIGNSSTIARGSVIPSRNTIANGSFVNKDFGSLCQNGGCLIAGSPASVKVVDICRIYDRQRERELDDLYGYSRTHL